ncbi:uncharacterized protein VP01_8983g1, partial [Puccinia sorghi]
VQSGWGRGLFKKPEAPVAPAIRVAAADAQGIVDTGATNHVSGCSHLLSNLRRLKQDILLNLASSDGLVMATHVGSLRLLLKHSMIKLDNVLYCPLVRGTLISLGQLLNDDFTIAFENQSMLLTALVHAIVWRWAVTASVAQSIGSCFRQGYQILFAALCSLF